MERIQIIAFFLGGQLMLTVQCMCLHLHMMIQAMFEATSVLGREIEMEIVNS